MPKTALIVIGIVYGISLAVAHVAHHPPAWAAGISVTADGARTFRLLGHELTLRLDVKRALPEGGLECAAPDVHLSVLGDSLSWLRGADPIIGRTGERACR
jgi:hypothetical protein